MDAAELLVQRFDTYNAEIKNSLRETQQKTAADIGEINARMRDVELRLARRPGSERSNELKSVGARVVEADQYKSFVANGARGSMSIKAVTSASNSAGSAVAPDRRDEVITLARVQPRVRSLIAPGQTNSNMVFFLEENVVTNNASVVAEGSLKPESNISYKSKESPVRVIAHTLTITRQIMDDAPQLMSMIDNAMRYMLTEVEDRELLLGDGTGEHLRGLIPSATAYDESENLAGDNPADTVKRAITQGQEASQLRMTGIIVNSVDWSSIVSMKDADGRYLSGGPFGDTAPRLWGLPVVETPSMPRGSFLVGNFTQAAQLFDRLETEVLISSEHADYFARNQLLVRCENRLAMVIKRPSALVFGSYAAP